jgi:hypothetical protein
VWSNGPMPEASSTAPEFDPLVVEQATPGDVAARLRRPWRGRVVGAGLAVVAAAVIVIVAVGDDNRSADVAEDEPAAETTVEPGPPATLAPVAARYPIGWSVVDVRDEAPQILPAAIADDWTEWSIPAPAPLDAMTLPTEVVAVTDAGVLHRIEFPSGQVSSRSLPELGPSGQIAVADGSVAIPTGNDVVLAGDDGSLVVWNVPSDRPPRVTTLGSRFLVGAAGEAGGPDRQWLLDVDGTVTDIPDGPFARFPAWEPFGLPSGELLADDGGDIVVVGLDGRVRPIDEGRLLAAGPNHYVVQTCYRQQRVERLGHRTQVGPVVVLEPRQVGDGDVASFDDAAVGFGRVRHRVTPTHLDGEGVLVTGDRLERRRGHRPWRLFADRCVVHVPNSSSGRSGTLMLTTTGSTGMSSSNDCATVGATVAALSQCCVVIASSQPWPSTPKPVTAWLTRSRRCGRCAR